jgi:hypothetical protein
MIPAAAPGKVRKSPCWSGANPLDSATEIVIGPSESAEVGAKKPAEGRYDISRAGGGIQQSGAVAFEPETEERPGWYSRG